jgi:hypothetical protein
MIEPNSTLYCWKTINSPSSNLGISRFKVRNERFVKRERISRPENLGIWRSLIRYKGKNIADVLDMTVEEAHEFFKKIPVIQPVPESDGPQYSFLTVLQEIQGGRNKRSRGVRLMVRPLFPHDLEAPAFSVHGRRDDLLPRLFPPGYVIDIRRFRGFIVPDLEDLRLSSLSSRDGAYTWRLTSRARPRPGARGCHFRRERYNFIIKHSIQPVDLSPNK